MIKTYNMNPAPFVSIIIPVLNAEKFIKSCLEAVFESDYPKERREVLVVDNGSSDHTVDIARQFNVKVMAEPYVTISTLRNIGARQARGEILAFLDADCLAPRHWLSAAVEALKKERVGAVGCWYQLPEHPAFVEKVWDLHASWRREWAGEIDWIPSGDLIISKALYEKIGGFNETLMTSEDVDICGRVHRAGQQIYSDHRLAVVHLGNPKTWRHFFNKEKWRGEGTFQHFISTFPALKWNKAVLFTLVMVVLLLLSLGGLFILTMKGFSVILWIGLAGFLFIPLMMSLKTMQRTKSWNYFLPLAGLFILYSLSRACSVFNVKVWKKNKT